VVYAKYIVYSDYKNARKHYKNGIAQACGKGRTGKENIRQISPQEMSPRQKAEKCLRYQSWLKENKERWANQIVFSKKHVPEQMASARRDPRWQHDPQKVVKEVKKIERVHAKLERYMAMHLTRMEIYYIKKVQRFCKPGYKIPKGYLLGESAKHALENPKGGPANLKVSSFFTSINLKSKQTHFPSGRITRKPSPHSKEQTVARGAITRGQENASPAKPTTNSRPPKYKTLNRPCNDPYTPHHRNLQLHPWATDAEIHLAYQTLVQNLGFRTLNYPYSQRFNATAARDLVRQAYSNLYISQKNRGPGYLYKYSWTSDPSISPSERARRVAESSFLTGTAQMPWFQPYHSPAECLAMKSMFCEEFLVNLSHKVLDTILPTPLSDYVWATAQARKLSRYPSLESSSLTFYGPCDEAYSVLQPVPQVLPGRWSYYRDSQLANTPLLKDGYGSQLMLLPLGLSLVLVFAGFFNALGRTLIRMLHGERV